MKLSLIINDHYPYNVEIHHADAVISHDNCDDICHKNHIEWTYESIVNTLKLSYTFDIETVDNKPQITIIDPVLTGYIQLFYDNKNSDDVEDTLFTANSFSLHLVESYKVINGQPLNYELDIDFQKMLIKILFL